MISRIGEAREKLGMSQEQLARITQIRRQSISEYELNKKRPGVVNLMKIAKALRCKPQELLILEESDY